MRHSSDPAALDQPGTLHNVFRRHRNSQRERVHDQGRRRVVSDARLPPQQGQLFDPSGFMPRRGNWTTSEILLHNISDAIIWLAYMAISIALIYFVRKKTQKNDHTLGQPLGNT